MNIPFESLKKEIQIWQPDIRFFTQTEYKQTIPKRTHFLFSHQWKDSKK